MTHQSVAKSCIAILSQAHSIRRVTFNGTDAIDKIDKIEIGRVRPNSETRQYKFPEKPELLSSHP